MVYVVEYLDTENRVYNISVEADNEEDAIEMAIDEANESYHGLKEILSIY